MRDDDNNEDTMESWTEEKLKEVVEKKHGESNKKMPTTDIVSETSYMLFLLHYLRTKNNLFSRFVNFSSTLLKIVNMVGFGVARMVLLVSIDTLFHPDLFLKK